jgi:acetyl-CoA carboxylase biotin carboxylase subunit
MADAQGNVVTYGERECSMQRRYQKVIEEAPSPIVTPEMRASLSDAARKAALAVDYRGAGTVTIVI